MKTQPAQEREEKTRRVGAGKTKKPDTAAVSSKPLVSECDDLQALIAKRAHELHVERGCRDGFALDDWLEAEREVLSQVPPVKSTLTASE
ncbi:MAG: DUF2934 domain-containing protein [Nitrospirota bacterium]|nr:DUF2934 domain-containing protein [Nitrospirota bacterium]